GRAFSNASVSTCDPLAVFTRGIDNSQRLTAARPAVHYIGTPHGLDPQLENRDGVAASPHAAVARADDATGRRCRQADAREARRLRAGMRAGAHPRPLHGARSVAAR